MLNVLYAMIALAILILIIASIDGEICIGEICIVEQAKAGFTFLILFFMIYCFMSLIVLTIQ